VYLRCRLQPATSLALFEVIAIADVINHLILSEAEFSQPIGHLLAAGEIGADPWLGEPQDTDRALPQGRFDQAVRDYLARLPSASQASDPS